jgi:hypothetical protein
MRGEVDPQSSMFHYFSVDSRIPADHPLRGAGAVSQRFSSTG